MSFEIGAGEEAAVQERNAAEGACQRGACARWSVECPEKERQEDGAVVGCIAFHAAGEAIFEESAVVIEPAFGLEEAEEEEA
ncbi:MAG TPA: hypothetical protein VN607_12645 [Gemmatimonadaceae bacterium]|nr:hypothetical protein [Gemmatimonadaceae bacterium]